MEGRWWATKRAQNQKAATYVCPFCDGLLHATSDHMLVVPEGDLSRRRHAHTECVVVERRAKRLPDQDEWRKSSRGR